MQNTSKLFELIDSRIRYNKKYNLLIYIKPDSHEMKNNLLYELDKYLLNKYSNYFIDKKNDMIKIFYNKEYRDYNIMIKVSNNINILRGYSFNDTIYYNPFNIEYSEREEMLLSFQYNFRLIPNTKNINLKYIFKKY